MRIGDIWDVIVGQVEGFEASETPESIVSDVRQIRTWYLDFFQIQQMLKWISDIETGVFIFFRRYFHHLEILLGLDGKPSRYT